MGRISEDHTQELHDKEGKMYDSAQEGDLELGRMAGSLFVTEYQIRRLRDRSTNNGMTTRTIDILPGHGQPRDASEFSFKYETNGKIYTISIKTYQMRRADECLDIDNDNDDKDIRTRWSTM